MASTQSLSFEELLCKLLEEKRYLLDCKVANDRHLAEIAQELIGWKQVLPYLMAEESEKTEEAIDETYQKTETKRLVSSELKSDMPSFSGQRDYIKPIRFVRGNSNSTVSDKQTLIQGFAEPLQHLRAQRRPYMESSESIVCFLPLHSW